MLTRPAKLLPVHFTLGAPLSADVDGKVYQFAGSLTMVNPQIHSDASLGGAYDLTNLKVGDYVATEPGGRIMKIVAIASQSSGAAAVTVEDELRQNQQQDPTGNSDAYITSNTGIVFEVVEGKPILFPYGDQSTEVVGFVKDYASEIQSRFEYLRQSKLIDVTQAHSFVVGDLITYNTGTSTYQLLTTNTVWVGTVIEIDNPITGSFRYRPTGSIVDIALAGAGPYFYWDNSNPGKLTSTAPTSGQRVVPAFFKLSSTQAIYFQGGAVTNLSGNFVTLDTAQTITGEKTFNAEQTFNNPTEFNSTINVTDNTNSSSAITGAIVVAGGVGIGDNLTVGGNISVAGDLTVSGTATIINTTNMTVSDKLIELATGTTGAPGGDSGIVIERGDENNVFFGWDESADVFTIGTGTFTGSSSGNLTLTDANIRVANASVTGTLNVTNTATFSGDIILGSDTTDNITVNADISSNVTPDSTSTYNLGSSSKRWDTVYSTNTDINGSLSVSGTANFNTNEIILTNSNAALIDHSMYVLYGSTSNSTQTELFLDPSSTRITLANNTTMMFEVDVIGRNITGIKHSVIKIQGVVDKTSNNTVLVNTNNQTIFAQVDNTWSVVVEADNTSDTIVVKVTGESGESVRWTAFVKTTSINHQ
jgi:hypothetical protein